MDLLSMVGDKLGTSYAAALAHNEEVGKKERMNVGCPHGTLGIGVRNYFYIICGCAG